MPTTTVRDPGDEADIIAASNLAGVDLKAAVDLKEFPQWLAFARAAHQLGKWRGRKQATVALAKHLKTVLDDAVENAS